MPTETAVFTDEEFSYSPEDFCFSGVCFCCSQKYFVYVEDADFETALDIADEIIDGCFDWWFVDGIWLCEKCT